jgi:hypothetical protein
MNINVNIPRRSMKGVLVFFQEPADAGNLDITDVQVTIEGLANKVFPHGLKTHQQWDEASRFFLPNLGDGAKMLKSHMDMETFYGND